MDSQAGRFKGTGHAANILTVCLGLFLVLSSLSACQGSYVYKGQTVPFLVSYVEEPITIDGSTHPLGKPVLINSTEDLSAYYDPNADPDWKEREKSGDVNNFVIATKRYDDTFFADKSLILIEDGTPSSDEPPWTITSVNRDGNTITITAFVPRVPPGTIQITIEFRWTTFIEIDKTELPRDADLELITES